MNTDNNTIETNETATSTVPKKVGRPKGSTSGPNFVNINVAELKAKLDAMNPDANATVSRKWLLSLR